MRDKLFLAEENKEDSDPISSGRKVKNALRSALMEAQTEDGVRSK